MAKFDSERHLGFRFNLDAEIRQLQAVIADLEEPEGVREMIRIVCEACGRLDMADEIFNAFLRVSSEELS